MESSNTVSVVYNTLVGVLKLEATSEGICSVKWLSTKQEETPRGQFTTKKRNDSCEETLNQKEDSVMSCSKANEHLKTCKAWLDAYFDGSLLKRHPPLPRPPLVLPMKGTFFNTVWETLTSTGVGETLSYKELAKLSGNPNAARAVGQAVKKHCIPILVPCHRVVKSTRGGSKMTVGNYSGGEGTVTKEWLLEHEKKMLKEQCGQ